ncbi:transposase family protein [Streptomyces sp. MCA2]|uniref:transposase family protein n=1 Tax=Streptomyces sp. MCA2 TaxID=2944805 RepID=UPI00202123C3|nr:transposase family protein [Streptomyces sp. MCA2]MCL7493176.1 transposase family protein [Streptomyces sp. MCA2]
MLVYPSAIELSSQSLRFLAQHLTHRRRELGTRWRKLPAGQQALLSLAHLRCGDTYAQLAAGFGVGVATVYRYIHEAVTVLAAVAPTLEQAVTAASAKAFVILDGTLLPIDRIAVDRPFYSGKHRKHGMNVQVITAPFGRLIWASPALPGATHDITAARTHRVIDALAEAGIKCFADKGYQGAEGTVVVPFRSKHRNLSAGKQAVNVAHAKIRAVGEQAMATLKGWRLLRKLRCSTTRITDIVKAVLTLHLASA